MDREEVKYRLTNVADPWLAVAFASRMALAAAPGLVSGGERGNVEYWRAEYQDHLLALLRSLQFGTSTQYPAPWYTAAIGHVAEDAAYAAFAITKSRPDGAQSNTAAGKAADLAACAAEAISATAQYISRADTQVDAQVDTQADTQAEAAYEAAYQLLATEEAYGEPGAPDFIEEIDSGLSYQNSFDSAFIVATKNAAHAAAGIACSIDDDNWYSWIREELSLIESRPQRLHYLERPFPQFTKRYTALRTTFLSILREIGSGFDYWADWLDDRFEGRPIDQDYLPKQLDLPEEVAAQSAAEINAYLKQLRDADRLEPLNKVRVIFLGYGEAGKTSLIRVLKGERVVEGRENMTPGVEVHEWPVPGSDILALFWDFGGQVMAHATHQFFLRSRCVYVLLLSARAEINANQQAEYWLEHVRAFGGDAPVLLVGNKSDQAQVNVDMNRLAETYPNICGFYPISCTVTFGIENFQDALVQQLRKIETHQVLLAKAHFAVIEALRKRSPTDPFLPKEHFETLCAQCGIKEDAVLNREWLLDLLDKLGVIIHFPNIVWLDDYILNPRWLTYGVYQIMYSARARKKAGNISTRDVATILGGKQVKDNMGNILCYPGDKPRLVVDAMREFKICYRLPSCENTLILPDLLPSDRPKELRFDRAKAMRFDFDFERFLPRHLMTMFTVQRHEEIVDQGLVWQNGVRLGSEEYGAQAMANADYYARRFSLWVSGGQTGRYFSVLRDEALKILKRMEKLRYTEWLWLPEEAQLKPRQPRSGDMARAKFLQLLALEAEGEERYVSEYGVYSLDRLLYDLPRDRTRWHSPIINVAPGGNFITGDLVGEKQMGDKFDMTGADMRGANIINKNMGDARQAVKAIKGINEVEKLEIEKLVGQLAKELDTISDSQRDQAEAVATITNQLLLLANAENPNRSLVEITGKGLKEAAEALKGAAPAIVNVVKQIVEMVS